MKVSEIVEKFGLEIYSGDSGLGKEVIGGYSSDLLSDVMGNATEGQVWVTLQTHQNIVAVASLKELAAIILVRGLIPDEETVRHSNEEGIPVLGSSLNAFDVVGKLYQFLNR